MNTAHPLPSTQETLHNAVLEAELLLSFAASHGINIENDILTTIVQGKHLLEAGADDAGREAKEIAFWQARSALAQALYPVTAESLKQFLPPAAAPAAPTGWLARWFGRKPTGGTGVETAIGQLQSRIFIPILILLLVQVYSLIGQNVVADLVPRMEKIQGHLSERQKLLQAEKPDVHKESLAILEEQVRLSEVEIKIRVSMLEKWNSGWVWITLPFEIIAPHHPPMGAQAEARDNDTRYQNLRAIVLQAGFVLQVLQNFIMPLLYGYLGASLFVLRALASDAKHYTFDSERRMSYNQRIYMGTLCGLVIAWFVPDNKVHDAGMSQYALSILGGYSVDIVFGLMDKIIQSLSSSGTEAGTKSKRYK